MAAAEASILLAAGVAQSAVVVTILDSAVAPIRQRVRAVPGGADLVAAIAPIGMGIAATLARSGIRTAAQMHHGEQPWDHRYESTTSPGPSIRT